MDEIYLKALFKFVSCNSLDSIQIMGDPLNTNYARCVFTYLMDVMPFKAPFTSFLLLLLLALMIDWMKIFMLED